MQKLSVKVKLLEWIQVTRFVYTFKTEFVINYKYNLTFICLKQHNTHCYIKSYLGYLALYNMLINIIINI